MSTPLHVSPEAKVCRNICQVTLGSPARFTAARKTALHVLEPVPGVAGLGRQVAHADLFFGPKIGSMAEPNYGRGSSILSHTT
jgi:hypothetical protein